MKSQEVIEKRLCKLYRRYARQYVVKSQQRQYQNCKYNHAQEPLQSIKNTLEVDIFPRKVSTIVMIQDQTEVHYCMYGAEDSEKWPGIICDNDDIAKKCKWFVPRSSIEEIHQEYMKLMQDDDYVYKTYPDITALQWVLDDRAHKHELSVIYRVMFWIWAMFMKFVFRRKNHHLLAPDVIPNARLDNLWSDNDSTTNSGS